MENDRVALLLPGSHAYVDAVLRLLTAGIFPIPLDPRLTATEQDRILAGLDPTAVVRTDDELAALVDPLPPAGLPLGRPMHCTSGTTGVPKGVFSGLLTPDDAAALVAEERDLWGFSPDDVNLVLSPLYHSAPLRFAMGTILAGGRIVGLDRLDQRLAGGRIVGLDRLDQRLAGGRIVGLDRLDQRLAGGRIVGLYLIVQRLAGGRIVGLDRLDQRLAGGRIVGLDRLDQRAAFDPAAVTATIEAERPTTMFCVPTHLQRLFAHWDEHGIPDLSSFRLVAHAGAPCPTDLKHRLVEAFPDGSTWEFYGSTEGQFTACRSEEWLARPGTVGRARPGRTLSTDPDGTIWCTVPSFARFTYFGAPDKTAAAWRETPDGPAFSVGDLGRIDPDGYLYLDGRREDLIISGGVNVYPTEVEQVLGTCPGVTDIAVYGVADPAWGQRVCAAVVGSVGEADLASYARAHLAPPKRPKDYVFVSELPRTLTGKVRRSELAAE